MNQSRVLVEYQVRLEEPKSRNGKRTLPLDDAVVRALTALHKLQLTESAAGQGYRGGLSAWLTAAFGKTTGPRLTPENKALSCGYVARSEGLEPPTF